MIFEEKTIVRALFHPLSIPESGTGLFTIFYPARANGSEQQMNMGMFPAQEERAPYPVVLLLNGVNCSPNNYQWLAEELVLQGYLVLSFHMVSEIMPGTCGLSPGMDFKALMPNVVGTRPSCPTIQVAIDLIQQLNETGPLEGLINTDMLFLGGHSGGGSMALLNANPDWFPQIKGAFSYAAHSGASVILGYPKGTVLPLNNTVPILLLGGSKDGVISASSRRYGSEKNDPATMIRRTFVEALNHKENAPASYFILLSGANHFSITKNTDSTAARAFLDFPEEGNSEEIRIRLLKLILAFLSESSRGQQGALSSLVKEESFAIEEFLCTQDYAQPIQNHGLSNS